MSSTLIADGIVAFLLVVTIFYAAKLNRKLSALRADKTELQALVQSLAEASQSAEAGVMGLKAGAEEIGRLLAKKMQDAQSLREDLAYMIDRGGIVADRLEGSLRTRREAKGSTANLIHHMASRLAASAPSRSERDLAQALAGRR